MGNICCFERKKEEKSKFLIVDDIYLTSILYPNLNVYKRNINLL